jgi:steroid delta-isomerase-like uncharacterized protein
MTTNAEADRIAFALLLFDAFAAGDLGAWEARLAPDFTFCYPGMPDGKGAAAACAYNQPFAEAFSDWKVEVHNAAIAGNVVMIEMTIHATHTGPLVSPEGTLPATHRHGAVKAALVSEISNGRIHREATYWNIPDLVMQIAPPTG